jgi:hypothetical protein
MHACCCEVFRLPDPRALLVSPARAIESVEATEAMHEEAGAPVAAIPAAKPEAPIRAEADLPLDPRFSAERIKSDIAFFADDLLEGRDVGSKGMRSPPALWRSVSPRWA